MAAAMAIAGGAVIGRSASRPQAARLSRAGLATPRITLAKTVQAVAAPIDLSPTQEASPVFEGGRRLANAPPFGLQDIREAIPKACFERNALRSFAYLALDVGVVAALAVGAYTLNNPFLWPLYWFVQGTMFWALFVVGHDCGHQSFSSSKTLNDFVGNIVHSTIMVPYHGWRISHRTHHANHGHVENDESWHPVTEAKFKSMDFLSKLGRLVFPATLFVYPFYLFKGSRGNNGSHYDPNGDLFSPNEAPLIKTSNTFQMLWIGLLAACTYALGPVSMLALYVLPYWVFVAWLDVVTYLHHHGPQDAEEEMPWYRGEEWNYMRGGLTTIDRDYGIFNKIHHDIGTHVVHHLFPQIPHYNLTEATEGAKKVMGDYYREPAPSPGPLPFHLIGPLIRSFSKDHYVPDKGNIVFYQTDPKLNMFNK